MTRKVAVVTGSRAEYGLLEPLIRRIRGTSGLKLQLIVTGAHLSSRFGRTVKAIEADGHPIAARVDLGLGPGEPVDVGASLGAGVAGCAKAYAKLKPDLLVVLGDRFEVLAAVAAAGPFRLPVAHLHGGESSDGVLDESLRHAITKLSHLHFPAAPKYAARIRQMGEDPKRIHCVGSPFIDRVREVGTLSRAALERELGMDLAGQVGVLTFHPETLDADYGLRRLDATLAAAKSSGATWVATYPGADAGGPKILARLKAFARGANGRFRLFDSLGQRRYWSLLRQADVMLGNSSSGVLEAPYFALPVVNVGDRQGGRIR
ncbi:MAG: UDP-N-acetylglucosamine 2-epimerase (hydrolyzing), partial [Elusimicrobia bacterium]|nr:UDP-N-acetylglucosamine 2-epimerase (hydrolyzing) [Elusimicrobiota bacterium]